MKDFTQENVNQKYRNCTIWRVLAAIYIFFSCVLTVMGLIVLAVSIHFRKKMSTIFAYPTGNPFDYYTSRGLTILIIIAPFIAVSGLIGCVGAFRKSTIILIIHVASLAIIIGAEIGVGMKMTNTKEMFNKFDNSFDLYLKNFTGSGKARGLDMVQNLFECCGGKDYNDLRKSKYFPKSCCAGLDNPDNCFWRRMRDRPGCKEKYRKVIKFTVFPQLKKAAIGIGVVESLPIVFFIPVFIHSFRADE